MCATRIQVRTSSGRRNSPRSGATALIVFGLIITAIAGLATYFMTELATDAIGMRSWTPAPCTITASDVAIDADEHQFTADIDYVYDLGGRAIATGSVRLDDHTFNDFRDAFLMVERFPVGSKTTCYINPDQLEQAVLIQASLWNLAVPAVSGLICLLGMGLVVLGGRMWRHAGRASKPDARVEPISHKARPSFWGHLGAATFFFVFFAAGMAFLTGMFLIPASRVMAAENWVATPCRIVYSKIRSQASDDGTTYRVDMLFSYAVDGRQLKSSRYNFATGSSSGREAKAAAVQKYPAGRDAVCFVDPDDPTLAVIDRGMSRDIWFGLFTLIFVVVGLGGMTGSVLSYRPKRRTAETAAWRRPEQSRLTFGDGDPLLALLPDFEFNDQPIELKPVVGKLGKLIRATFGALFWNGIVSVFIWVWHYELDGGVKIAVGLFLTPFAIIGVGLIGAVFHRLLATFNPTPMLTVSRIALPLGSSLDVAWDVPGGVGKVQRLTIILQGFEEATYTVGTNTRKDESIFFEDTLIDTSDQEEIASGAGSLVVPSDTMHSLKLKHNVIRWRLKLEGEIPRWPDVDAEYALVVLPQDTGAA